MAIIQDNEYQFVINPFDIEYFQNNVLDMVTNYFCRGVIVNNIPYTMEDGIFPVKGGKDHVPSEYHEGACALFLGEILLDVSQDEFSDDAQMDVISQISEIMTVRDEFSRIVIRTSNIGKKQQYGEVLYDILEKEIHYQPYYGFELQAPTVMNSAEKVRSAQILEGDFVFAQDMSLELEALGGAPGPYVRQFVELNPPKRIDEILAKLGDVECCVEIALSGIFFFEGNIKNVHSIIRCKGKWINGSKRDDIEDSFSYLKQQCVGTYRLCTVRRTGKGTSLLRVSLYWLLIEAYMSKPSVKVKIKRSF